MDKRMLRIGVVGGGMFFDDIIGQSLADFQRGGFAGCLTSIGASHLAPQVADIGVEFAAIATRSEKRGTAGAIRDRFLQSFPDSSIQALYGEQPYKEIIDSVGVDVLLVATPDHLHYPAIMYALENGVHVITEKPMCLKTTEADRIIETANANGLIVAVDMHKRYDPFVRDMMSSARDRYGALNRVRAVLEEPLEVSTEVFRWAADSNPFAYVGCHWLDVVGFYLGVVPKALYATGEKNLLAHWSRYAEQIASAQHRQVTDFLTTQDIDAWDSLNVNITYDDGMRGDYNNTWINPREFEGAVNQEIEVYGVLGRGMVDQQDRGYRETITGDGSRTRNPAFGGRVSAPGRPTELFGYGKASLAAGLLAVSQVRFLGSAAADLAGTYPDAASQRSITMIVEAAGVVAQRNLDRLRAGQGCPVSARFTEDAIIVVDPYAEQVEQPTYQRG